MSLTRLKNSIMRKTVEWGGTFRVEDMPGTKVGRYGRLTPSIRKRQTRIYNALMELVAEGKLKQLDHGEWVTR